MFYRIGDTPEPVNLTYQQRVKEKNIKRIFDFLRSGECESRAELVRAMALSATSISALVEELQGLGYIEETGPKQTAQPGRRPIRLRFSEDSRQIAVFSLAQRGIRFSLMDLRCRVLENLFVPFDSTHLSGIDAGPLYAEQFLEVLQGQSRLFDRKRTICVGVTIPGVYKRSSHTFSMVGSMGIAFSLGSMERFQERLGIPVYMANTTACQAYAEKKHMDAQGADAEPIQDLMYVNVCDGVGASFIVNGNLFIGPNGNAGEIGHMTIDYQGRPCACGNRGCLERYVNLNAILDACQRACAEAGIEAPSSFEALVESFLSVPQLERPLVEAAEYLSCGIYNMICATGIQRVAVGGGIEALGNRFLAKLREAVRRHSKLFCDELNLEYAVAGSQADDIGLGHYFLDNAYTITY